jgi:putative PEP-CTERM system TPR-repeat lipoprotein
MKTVPLLTFRKAGIAVALVVSLALVACDDGGSVDELIARAKEDRSKHQLSSAVIQLKNALQEDPKSVAARGLLGIVSLDLGDVGSAQKELERARDLGWPITEYVRPLGRIWILRGDMNKVLDEFVVTDDMTDDTKAKVLTVRAEAWRALQEVKRAEEALEQARALAPDDAQVYAGLGRLAMQRRELDAAAPFIEKSVALAPDDADVVALEGDYEFARQKYPEAEAAYARLATIQFGNPFPLLPLARAMLVNGKLDEAIVELDKFLKVLPRHPVGNFLRARAAYDKKDYEAALSTAKAVLEVAPGHLPSRLLAGAAAYALQQYELASSYLEVYVGNQPENNAARRLLGATQLRLGQSKQSLETLKPLVGENVNDVELLALAGQAALQSRDFEASTRYFEQASRSAPDNARTRAQLGVVQAASGNIEQGITELEKAVAEDPKLNEAVLALALANLREKHFEAAIENARQFQQNNPKYPTGYMLEGIANLGLNNVEAAKAMFNKVLELRPGAPDASANLAAIEINANNADGARALLTGVLEHFPDDLGTMLRLADLEERQGNQDKAADWLQRAEKAHPTESLPKLQSAQLLLRQGKPAEALARAQAVLAAQSGNTQALDIAGRANLAVNNIPAAKRNFEDLLKQVPDNPGAHYLMALAHRADGDGEGNRRELQKVLELNPNDVRAKVDLAALAIQSQDNATADKYLAELKQSVPDNPYVRELQGVIAMRDGKFAEAAGLLESAFAQIQTTPLAMNLALAHRRAGDKAAGRRTLEKWLEAHPGDAQARFGLANDLLADDDITAAGVHYAKLIETVPDNVAALNNLAWVLLRQGKASEAQPHIERAMSLVPNEPRIMDTAALIYLDRGKTGEAIDLLRKSVAALPDNTEINLHLAQALAKSGDRAEARDILKKLLAGGQFPERAEAEKLLKTLGE